MRISKERMTLVSSDANQIFGDVVSIDADYSFGALLRAIIINHSEYTVNSVRTGSVYTNYNVLGASDAKLLFEADNIAVAFGCMRSSYSSDNVEAGEGWAAMDGSPYPISRYLSQFTKTRVFVNADKKRVIAFVDGRISHLWLQAFMSTLPRIMTWYFPEELSSEEQEFFKSISVGNTEISEEAAINCLVEYVNKAAEQIDFRSLDLHKKLDGFADRIRESGITQERERIAEIGNELERLHQAISEAYSRLEHSRTVLNGLILTPKNESTTIFDFFNQHKQIKVISTNRDNIKFGVIDTLEYYDEDEFEYIIDSDSSYLYDEEEVAEEDSDIIDVLRAVFLDKKGVFLSNAVFNLSSMRYVNPISGATVTYDALPNPHIYHYGCSGGHEQYYSQYAESGDWELAVEQAIAATKNLNFGDSTVVTTMIRWLSENRNVPCIYIENKTRLVSVNEFQDWVAKERENG